MKKWFAACGGMILAGCLVGCASLPGTAWATDARELRNVKRVALACHLYACEHGEMWPQSAADLVPYEKAAQGTDYEFDLGRVELLAKGSLLDEKCPTTTVLLRSRIVSSTGKRAVAFADGHGELVPGE